MCCYRFPITRKGGESEFEMNSWLKYCAFCWVVFWCGENMGLRWGIKERSIPTKVQRKGTRDTRGGSGGNTFLSWWESTNFDQENCLLHLWKSRDLTIVFVFSNWTDYKTFQIYLLQPMKIVTWKWENLTKFYYEMFISRFQKAKNIVKYA
jgi:hypothetical protein